ncbi:hypothetical protein HETIRDRAFT_456507 [Heterobasidion irregulare TC 32-1]|uniref:Amine oxidase domain-containing protein n=1 Tax=Heterobasidion irregulare (strain TC 32-1) TaxID=747525 RepID=W4JPP0_HETIT|nr:uncharacterized protein HETIRDRAFT_456507 [Heterobasidion irregulare TC 32-1]ETW75055.1 hypothetical protein HETIRDRAFT_456507 [Heterobasidion irregulare TC 32-1]
MRQCGTVPHGEYDDQVISYLEIFDTGTGFYDLALSEIVLDFLDFEYDGDEMWYCIQGDASVIANAMAQKLPEGKIFNGKRVTAIAPTTSRDQPPRTYSHVISTISLSCLRMVDTSHCKFSWGLQTAIRSLHYATSTKVTIKFNERWWERMGQVGGVSNTDRPTRAVVYPSYGIGGTDATMIVSYTWAQDVSRFSPFSGNRDSEKAPLDVISRDLADMHGTKDHNDLRNLVSDHGAFAHFGPGQFSQLYPQVTKPAANGKLHFAGEATSVYHGWVVSALNSAARAIYELAYCEGREDLVQEV